MGFKLSQQWGGGGDGGHWVWDNQQWDSSFLNNGGDIGFGVTSNGIQAFPTMSSANNTYITSWE